MRRIVVEDGFSGFFGFSGFSGFGRFGCSRFAGSSKFDSNLENLNP
jgi:hypothetical protein